MLFNKTECRMILTNKVSKNDHGYMDSNDWNQNTMMCERMKVRAKMRTAAETQADLYCSFLYRDGRPLDLDQLFSPSIIVPSLTGYLYQYAG
jgi:hypothetical protein